MQTVFILSPLLPHSFLLICYQSNSLFCFPSLEYGSLKPAEFAGAKDMDTAIFQAGKAKKGGKKGNRKSKAALASQENDAVIDEGDVDVTVPEASRQNVGAVMYSTRSAGAVPVKGAYEGFEEEDLGDYT